MGRDVPFDFDDKCDKCGKPGAWDFMGDYLCPDCCYNLIAFCRITTTANRERAKIVTQQIRSIDMTDEPMECSTKQIEK